MNIRTYARIITLEEDTLRIFSIKHRSDKNIIPALTYAKYKLCIFYNAFPSSLLYSVIFQKYSLNESL